MRKKSSFPWLSLCLILCVICLPLQIAAAREAESNDDSGSAVAEIPQFTVKISGENTLKIAEPVAEGKSDLTSITKAPTLDSTIKMEFGKGELRYVSEWDALTAATAIKDSSGAESTGIGSGSTYLSLKPLENALYLSTDKAKFGLGWQYFTWGVADEINPTDYLNARDFRYGSKDKKIPVFSGSATWYPTDEWSLEGVLVPQYQACNYGMNWADTIPSGIFGSNARNVIEETPAAKADSFTGALRGRYFGTDVDASLSYLYGWDRYVTPEISITDTGEVDSVALTHRRLHRFGGDVKFVVGKFGFWGEAAYSTPEMSGKSYEYRKPELSWVTGFDFNFGSLDEHYVNIQYLGTFIPGFDDSYVHDYANGLDSSADVAYLRKYYYRSLVQGLGLQTERLLQGVAGTVELSFLEGRVKPTFDYIGTVPFGYDDTAVTRYGSLVLMPKLVLLPIDGLRVTVGSEMAWSFIKEKGGSVKLDRNDKIGQLTDDNRVYLEVSYSWLLP